MSKTIKFEATIRVPDEQNEWSVGALEGATQDSVMKLAAQFSAYVIDGPDITVTDEMAADLQALFAELNK